MTIETKTRAVVAASIAALALAGCGNDDGGTVDDGNVVEDNVTESDAPDEADADAGSGTAVVVIGDETYEADGLNCDFGDDFFTYRGTTSEDTGAAIVAGNGSAGRTAAQLIVHYEGTYAGPQWNAMEWEDSRGVLFDDPSFSVDVDAGTLSGRAEFMPVDELGNFDADGVVEGTFDISCD